MFNVSMKQVTAIITTHNRLELLKRAIRSVLDQTYPDIELIVVDDHSDDGTKEYCLTQDFKYIYIPSEESNGGNYARNLGIKNASGEYIAFLDDDDYWLPQKIDKQVALIESIPNCEMVYCGMISELIGRDGEIEELKYHKNEFGFFGDMSKKILLTICCTTTTIMATKHILYEVGMFDESLRFWQEYELTIRLAQKTTFHFVNEPLVVYRIDTNDKNRLTNKYWEWKAAVKKIHQKHSALYSTLGFIERMYVSLLICNDAIYRTSVNEDLKIYHCMYLVKSYLLRIVLKLYKVATNKKSFTN